jgi:hypothetical protein
MGVRTEIRDLFPEFGAFGASIHARVDPAGGAERDALVLALPLFGSGDSGAERYDIAEALLLLEKLAARPLAAEIRVAFLGSEYSRLRADIDAPRQSGLKDLLNLYSETAKLIYLDIPAAPGTLVIHNGSQGDLSPLEMIRPFSALCEAEELPYDFSVHFNELYKLALAGETGPLEIAQDRDFPSFLVKGQPGPPLARGKLADLIYRYLETLESAPPDMDYHYSLFYIPGKTSYLSETAMVFVFLAAAALTLFILLVYSIVNRPLLMLQWEVFFKRFWIVGLLFLLLSVSLFGAELWSILVKRILGLQDQGDTLLTALKILCAAALYTVLVPYFSRLEVPRKGNYFGSAAVLLSIAGSLIALVLDLSFVFLFLWACLFALLGSLFKKAPLVVICAILTPLQILAALIELARGGHTRIFDLVGSGNIYVTFYTALILLPCFLLLHRAGWLSERSKTKKLLNTAKIKSKLKFIKRKRLIAAGASLLLFFSWGLWLSRSGGEKPVWETVEDDGSFLAVKAESRVFLDRRIIGLTLEAGEVPGLFTVALESPEPLIVYDTSMPYRFSQDNRSVSFILGEAPNNPFHAEFVLPQNFSCNIRAGALYDAPVQGLSHRTGTAGYTLTVERVLALTED